MTKSLLDYPSGGRFQVKTFVTAVGRLKAFERSLSKDVDGLLCLS